MACQDVQRTYALALLDRSASAQIGLFRHGQVIDSNCTSCGQCVATCPTLAIRQKEPIDGPEEAPASTPALGESPSHQARGDGFPAVVRRVETTCPYCGVGCGIDLHLSAHDRLIQVDDVPANRSSQGLLCVKGRFGAGFVHSPGRLTTPLIRRVRDGPHEPASWDEALDLVADRLARHRGSVAVLGSAKTTNEDSYVLQKFARVVLGTNNVDHCSRLCHAPSVAGMTEMLGSGSTTNSYTDFDRAGCLMVVGSDTDVNHPVIASRLRRAIEENGARLIVVNPRRIRLCDLAEVWLRPRPGTDVALFNGLARIILCEGWWDETFVSARTEGFDDWRAAVEPYTPSEVTRIAGVSEDQLEAAARIYARPGHSGSCILWGMGITQHTTGVANVQSMANLALLTGQVGKPGSGLAPLRGQNNVQGCGDSGVLPDNLPGYQGLSDGVRAKFAAAWGTAPPEPPGLKLTEVFDAAIDGSLRALYLVGENPMLTEPNLAHAEQGLRSLDFLVFQGAFMNETAELADVVLPAAVFAEKEGTFTNSERRVQLVRRALDAPGEAQADWAITCEIARRLAKRLGRSADGFGYQHPRQIFAEMAALVPFLAGMSHERLESGGLQWPCPASDHPGSPLLFAESFPRGRATFMPVEQGPLAAELPDAEYPLVLNTGRVLYHWHGGDLSRQVPGLIALYPSLEISVHPDDARRAGIRGGARMRVTSRRGSITGTTQITLAQREGEIFIPFVRLDDGAANLLTNNAYEPRVGIPEYKACAVRIEPV